MDDGVATGAITPGLKTKAAMRHISREWIHVTLQTQKPALSADQQILVHIPMRHMTGNAAFYLHGSMFENVWSSLLNMATDTGLPIRLSQHRRVLCAVWTVAIGALH